MANFYLPFVFCYFDESGGRYHFTKFAGELLAIEEFNNLSSNKFRKIDTDRSVWNEHMNLYLIRCGMIDVLYFTFLIINSENLLQKRKKG